MVGNPVVLVLIHGLLAAVVVLVLLAVMLLDKQAGMVAMELRQALAV
jgi:type IV secretory pathway TrbD component